MHVLQFPQGNTFYELYIIQQQYPWEIRPTKIEANLKTMYIISSTIWAIPGAVMVAKRKLRNARFLEKK